LSVVVRETTGEGANNPGELMRQLVNSPLRNYRTCYLSGVILLVDPTSCFSTD